MSETADLAIIGGGIVGLATAFEASRRFPGRRILVLEKEPAVGAHQSSHNSGVLHTGIYYKPGSLKARNCRLGKAAMEAFCGEHGVPFEICGKVIVAVDEAEIPALERIYQRGQQNQVECRLIDTQRLRDLEPHAAGVRAIEVPGAGIVDYLQVCRKLAELIAQSGGSIVTGQRITSLTQRATHVDMESASGHWTARCVVNCTGLYSDRVTRLSRAPVTARIIPFRGEYYELKPEHEHLCRNLIYPVPNPAFPFLGVHFTRMIQGGVECGPNAVLAFAREGYRMRDINLRDLGEALTYTGFLRLSLRYWRIGIGEMWRSLSKPAFVKALRRLMPEIRSAYLTPARAGVRAQAIAPDGAMVDDFLIVPHQRVINVCNAPSPAATSSLQIGQTIAERLDAYDL